MPGKAEMSCSIKNGKTKRETHTESESMSVDNEEGMPEGPVKLGYAEGKTINLGDYWSARVDVSLEMPCTLDKAVIKKMAGWMQRWVKEALKEEVDQLWKEGRPY